MITRPTKQSFDPAPLLPALLFFLLLGFFSYSIWIRPEFFLDLVVVLLIGVGYLTAQRMRLTQKMAVLSLQKQGFLEKTNLLAADIQKEIGSIESIHEKIIRFSQLKDLTEKLGMSFSVPGTSDVLAREAGRLFGGTDITAILYFLHAKTGRLSLSSAYKDQKTVSVHAKKGDIYDHWVVSNMTPLLVKDTHSDFRLDRDKIDDGQEARDFRSLMSVPMMLEDKVSGVLRLDSPLENYFDTDDIRLLATVGYIGAVAADNARLYEKVEDLAVRDGLTGLFLRRYLLERLSHEIKRELRRKKELAFLMVDLDRFKQYNDTYGHTAGDIVLKTVALVLSGLFAAPGNIVCRYGGEEFSVLLPDCSKEEALKQAEILRKTIEDQTIILRRKKTRMTVSIGVAVFPRDAQIKEELIQQADQALYRAKKAGRNRVCAA